DAFGYADAGSDAHAGSLRLSVATRLAVGCSRPGSDASLIAISGTLSPESPSQNYRSLGYHPPREMGRSSRVLTLVLLALTLASCGGASKSESDLSSDALNHGLKAHNAGNFDEATAAYFEALSHDAKNKFAYFNLGQIAQTQKR